MKMVSFVKKSEPEIHCQELDLPNGTYRGQLRGFRDAVFYKCGHFATLLTCNAAEPSQDYESIIELIGGPGNFVRCKRVRVELTVTEL